VSKRDEQVRQSNVYRSSKTESSYHSIMVPVIDQTGKPLFPCKERRARCLMQRKEAVAYWQKGIFCIRLVRKETDKREEYQPIALGIDTGSKREGYTVLTPSATVLNITTNTPDWVKAHVETRRSLRRARRQRKTPYRKCRENRATLRKPNRIPPSTKARWQAKLRIISILQRILPITHINVEDIAAVSKTGKANWNLNFSPLEVGKEWFYGEVEKLGVRLSKTEGTDTKKHRDNRGFKKLTGKQKMLYTWEAHNCDSHSLAEMVLKQQVKPFLGLYQVEFLEYYRRQLHKQNPKKGGIRKPYGTTVSLGLPRGSTVRYRNKLAYLGGTSKGRLSLHTIETGKRITQNAKKADVQMLHSAKHTTQFIRSAVSSPSKMKPLDGVSTAKKT